LNGAEVEDIPQALLEAALKKCDEEVVMIRNPKVTRHGPENSFDAIEATSPEVGR